MIAVIYADDGPSDPCPQGTCYARAARGVHLFDSAEEAQVCIDAHAGVVGRKNRQLMVFLTERGDIITDHRGRK